MPAIHPHVKRDAIQLCESGQLGKKGGIRFNQVADYLEVSEGSVRRWWKHWKARRYIVVAHRDIHLDPTHRWCIVDTKKSEIIYCSRDDDRRDADDVVYSFL